MGDPDDEGGQLRSSDFDAIRCIVQVPPDAKGAEEGEARTVAAFNEDPYGCSTAELLQKRLRRDPFAVGPIHPSRCPDMKALLLHCSPDIFSGALPWVPGRD